MSINLNTFRSQIEDYYTNNNEGDIPSYFLMIAQSLLDNKYPTLDLSAKQKLVEVSLHKMRLALTLKKFNIYSQNNFNPVGYFSVIAMSAIINHLRKEGN